MSRSGFRCPNRRWSCLFQISFIESADQYDIARRDLLKVGDLFAVAREIE